MGERVQSNYDDFSDVLYLSLGEPRDCVVVDDEDDVLLREAYDDGSHCGVTVLWAKAAWSERRAELAKRTADWLGVEPADVLPHLAAIEARQ